MESPDDIVTRHYSIGNLADVILRGLTAAGKDLDNLSVDDLTAVDEFHIGGRAATVYAVSRVSLTAHDHVLDVGSGIGGAARTVAHLTGCRVSGIDLTPEFVAVSRLLSDLTGLADRTDFQTASALFLPFAASTFDAAMTFHVAMNIKDCETLYSEIARVLKPNAKLCIYDVMKLNNTPLSFPVPWAMSEGSSHLRTPENVTELLQMAGFDVLEVDDRSAFARTVFERQQPDPAGGRAPLGPHLVMGTSASEKIRNIKDGVARGCVAPVQIIAVKT